MCEEYKKLERLEFRGNSTQSGIMNAKIVEDKEGGLVKFVDVVQMCKGCTQSELIGNSPKE